MISTITVSQNGINIREKNKVTLCFGIVQMQMKIDYIDTAYNTDKIDNTDAFFIQTIQMML